MEGRKAILRVHAKGKPLAPDVDLEQYADQLADLLLAAVAA